MSTNSSQNVDTVFDPKSWKKFIKFKYLASWISLGFLFILAWLPNRFRDWIAIGLSYILALIPLKPGKVAKANLRLVFPDYTQAQLDKIYRKNFAVLLAVCLGYGEPLFLPKFMLARKWYVKNPEVLQEAVATKRPLIFSNTHANSLDRNGLYLSFSGLPMTALVNKQKNPVYDWFLNKLRVAFGGKIFYREGGLRCLIKSLREHNHLYVLSDEDLGEKNAIFAKYFGIEKSTLGIVPLLAKKSNAVVIVQLMSYNLAKARYEMEFVRIDDQYLEDPVAMLNKINEINSNFYLEHPEQYMWFFRFFKTLPDARYFEDIYFNIDHKEQIEINFKYRRVPLQVPKKMRADYVPPKDYTELAKEYYANIEKQEHSSAK